MELSVSRTMLRHCGRTGNELKRLDFKDAEIEIFHASEIGVPLSLERNAELGIRFHYYRQPLFSQFFRKGMNRTSRANPKKALARKTLRKAGD